MLNGNDHDAMVTSGRTLSDKQMLLEMLVISLVISSVMSGEFEELIHALKSKKEDLFCSVLQLHYK